MVNADVFLGRTERNLAEARVAPPGVLPLAILIEGAVVVARDAGAGKERDGAFAERLGQRREGNHAGFLARRPRLHDLPRREVDVSVGIDRHGNSDASPSGRLRALPTFAAR